MRPNRPPDLLRNILDFITRIEAWTSEGAADDERTFYAILHALQYIGEAVTRLPADVTDLAPEIPWAKIRAMRNVVAHDYAGIPTSYGRRFGNDSPNCVPP